MKYVCIAAILLLAVSSLIPASMAAEDGPSPRVTQKTVLFELFAGVNNTNCGDDENASARLAREYGRDQLAILQWYKAGEALSCPGSQERFAYYAIADGPRAFADGRDTSSFNTNNETQTYNTFKEGVVGALNDTPSMIITGTSRMGPANATVNATVHFTGTVPNTALAVYAFLYEDNIVYNGRDNVTIHRYVVRGQLGKTTLTSPLYRSGDNFTSPNYTFNFQPSWKKANLGIVFALQSDGSRAVLQAKVMPLASATYGVDVTPGDQTIDLYSGKSSEVSMKVKNTGTGADTISLALTGTEATWGTLSKSSAMLGPSEETTFKVSFFIPTGTAAGKYAVTVRGSSGFDPSRVDEAAVNLNIKEELVYGVSVSPEKSEQEVSPGRTATFQLKVKNTGTLQDTIDLQVMGPMASWGSLDKNALVLPPSEEASVTLTVSVPDDTSAGRYDLTVKGTSRADGSKSVEATASVRVAGGAASGSYRLELQPRVVTKGIAPGASSSITLTVTNTGDNRDVADFSKTGDASGWAVLDPLSVDLNPGAQAAVDLEIDVPSSAAPGRYLLTVRATSRGDPTVRADCSITLDISVPEEPPKILTVSHTPGSPTSKDVVTVSAVVSGTGISKVEITYSEGSVTHAAQRMSPTGTTYTFAMGPFKADTVIKYKVSVSTSSGKTNTTREYSFTVSPVPTPNEEQPGFELVFVLAAIGVCLASGMRKRRN